MVSLGSARSTASSLRDSSPRVGSEPQLGRAEAIETGLAGRRRRRRASGSRAARAWPRFAGAPGADDSASSRGIARPTRGEADVGRGAHGSARRVSELAEALGGAEEASRAFVVGVDGRRRERPSRQSAMPPPSPSAAYERSVPEKRSSASAASPERRAVSPRSSRPAGVVERSRLQIGERRRPFDSAAPRSPTRSAARRSRGSTRAPPPAAALCSAYRRASGVALIERRSRRGRPASPLASWAAGARPARMPALP